MSHTIIQRIGQFSIVQMQHSQLFAAIDRENKEIEFFARERDAREYIMEHADLVSVFEAIQ